ncbi:Uncharacterised protein r2_g1580 [Pycnogonum litorale]
MRTVTNYFLLNLSFADFLMATLNTIFNFIFMLDSHWPFGSVYCTVNNFMANVTVASSVFTIVAMSFDRYAAIVRPLNPRMSKYRAVLMIVMIWIASCLLSVPTLLYSTTMTWEYNNGQYRTLCFLLWPDGAASSSKTDYVYNVMFWIITYVLPLSTLLITYTIMGRVLWGNSGIGEISARQFEKIKSKRRVVRMFIVVVTSFTLCWLPYHIFFMYSYHNNDVLFSTYVQHLYLGFYWLAMSNAMYNPIVYYWMNGRFRLYFNSVLCCWKKLGYLTVMNRTLKLRGRGNYDSTTVTPSDGQKSVSPSCFKLKKTFYLNYQRSSSRRNKSSHASTSLKLDTLNRFESI